MTQDVIEAVDDLLPEGHGKNNFSPLRPGDAYMHQWTGSFFVKVVVCRLFGAKLNQYCQLDFGETWVKYDSVHLRKYICKCCLQNDGCDRPHHIKMELYNELPSYITIFLWICP